MANLDSNLVDFDNVKGMIIEVDLVAVYTGKRAWRC
jgi:hypothetical protein